MRNLFLLLLLANILFFGWDAMVRETGEPGVDVVDAAEMNTGVALVDPAQEPAVNEEPAALDTLPAPAPEERPLVARTGPVCVSVGPYEAVAEASNDLKGLRVRGLSVAQRAAQGQVLSGHWVFIENIPSRGEARAMLQKLKDGGIPEASLFAGDAGQDLISLGLFSVRAGAERTELKADAMGLDATLAPRYREDTVFWLDILLDEQTTTADMLDQFGGDRVLRDAEAICPPLG
ncbi:MAG: hypothetical protein AAGF46_00185 [Pseudomonadota bacterium]